MTDARLHSRLMKSFSQLMKGRRVETPQLDQGHDGAVNSAASNVTTAAVLSSRLAPLCPFFFFKEKLDSQPIGSGALFIPALCAEHTIRNDVMRWRESENLPSDTEESTVTATRERRGLGISKTGTGA